MKLSVIIPIYNVERYLPHCLNSIDFYNRDDIEIILVNDGSTDNCLKICQEYAQRYSNVNVVDKPNGGLSDARNVGIKLAKGEYIYFLDSDDWLTSGAMKTLYNFAIENECDVVQGGFYYAYSDHLLYDNRFINEEMSPFVLSRDEAMRELIRNEYVKNFAWGKIYKSSIVKKHPNPFGKFFEDSYWQHLIVDEVEKYGVIPQPLYYYRQREDAISGRFSIRNIDLLNGNKERLEFIKEHYPQYEKLMRNRYYNSICSTYSSAMRHGNKATRKVYKYYLKTVDTSNAPLWFKLGKIFPMSFRINSFCKRCKSWVTRKTGNDNPMKIIHI